jgi:hypothetical protein
MSTIGFFVFMLCLTLSTSLKAQCLEGDCMNGKGVYTCDCGYVFEGFFENGEKVKGTLTKKDLVYTGQFENDQAHGKGKIIYKDGSAYVGDFAFSEPHGIGIYTLSNGFVYSGEMNQGFFSGMGEKNLTEPDSVAYWGFWNNDQLLFGVYLNAKNEYRIGHFENDKMKAYGLIFNSVSQEIVFAEFAKGKSKRKTELPTTLAKNIELNAGNTKLEVNKQRIRFYSENNAFVELDVANKKLKIKQQNKEKVFDIW